MRSGIDAFILDPAHRTPLNPRSVRRHAAGALYSRTDARRPLPWCAVNLSIELEHEDDGRWIAEVPSLPGVLAYGHSREEALAHVQALALRVIAERLEHGETAPELLSLSFMAA